MDSCGDLFTGVYRKKAKTSIVRTGAGKIKKAETFTSLTALIATLMDNITMAAEHENLVIAASAPEAVKAAVLSDRVDAEKRNVEVDCWLYHTRKEDDHDFHLILGSTATEAIATAYLTAEVSGLPEGGKDVDKLKAACRQFNDLCKQHLSQDKLDDIKDKYLDFTPPLRVRVRGSLFFDGQHKPGTIGPGKHKPKKAWEIHPMISIEAL